MDIQPFIFTPGVWIGEGKITFTTSHQFIKFYTKWQINALSKNEFEAVQIVEMQGVEDHVINKYIFTHAGGTNFSLLLN